ncbi:sulfur dehydrogenase subunit SoxD [Salinihabitans flavidus]|uniref:Sulfur dehydrogenase subunit SoxD n=1 Tax=Salinihabitans flavidus TaxID=569882 RepID=A0A1H8QDY8_9RHOB|nr:c-type cytochrome [Salinihabitans flavidus]SEO52450.1 sulfur dehydrogenase subunit SoxD [Salinihabitans flavidus]
MSKYLNLGLIGAVAASLGAAPALADGYGLGRAATADEIAAWDLDVMPDGTGLPEGSGSVSDGEDLFVEHCAVCHGDFAEGVGNWPALAGGEGSLADEDPVKTVGSYWPYLSTAWDYVHRSMPYGNAQILSADETYAIVAYILYSNYIVEDDFVLTKDNFLDVEMPNADGFIVDDRETAEAHFWDAEPCTENCKDEVEITMRATVLDVTPQDDAEEAIADQAAAEEPAAEEAETQQAALDPELVAEGEKVFRKCQACHQVGEGAKNRVGPQLNGIVGASVGRIEDFRYSKPMAELGESGEVWTEDNLAAFLAKPRDFLKGTKMSFAGLRKEEDQAAVIEYLKSFEE